MLLNLKYKPSALPPLLARHPRTTYRPLPSSTTYQRHRACAPSIQKAFTLAFFFTVLDFKLSLPSSLSLFLFSLFSRLPLLQVDLKFFVPFLRTSSRSPRREKQIPGNTVEHFEDGLHNFGWMDDSIDPSERSQCHEESSVSFNSFPRIQSFLDKSKSCVILINRKIHQQSRCIRSYQVIQIDKVTSHLIVE